MKAILIRHPARMRESGSEGLRPRHKQRWLKEYDVFIEQAEKLYGALKRKRGRAKKPKVVESVIRAAGRKPACRLIEKRDKILLFMHDSSVPFDNNQAERDLRMLKVKQEISGRFRTEKGAEEFCRLRSYVSTMKKQGQGVMGTIRSVFAGKVLMPALRC